MPAQKIVIYETQDARRSLVVSRVGTFTAGESPVGIAWLYDNSLLVWTKTTAGHCSVKTIHPNSHLPGASWPPQGESAPGELIDAGGTTQVRVRVCACAL